MAIVKVHYKKLFSLGNYENESIGAEAFVNEGEDASTVLNNLKAWCDDRHADNLYRRDEADGLAVQVESHRREIREINSKLEVVRDRWSKAKEFLARHGIDVEDMDIPF